MAYQPNPFVNPNHRGVELPEGCKDLFEALDKAGPRRREGHQRPAERGSLKDLTAFMQRLYLEPRGYYLLITSPEVRGAVSVLHRPEGGFQLGFRLRNEHKVLEKGLADVFGKSAFIMHGKARSRRVSAVLPEMWLEATEIVEKVIRGYGASENTLLLFRFGILENPAVHHEHG